MVDFFEVLASDWVDALPLAALLIFFCLGWWLRGERDRTKAHRQLKADTEGPPRGRPGPGI